MRKQVPSVVRELLPLCLYRFPPLPSPLSSVPGGSPLCISGTACPLVSGWFGQWEGLIGGGEAGGETRRQEGMDVLSFLSPGHLWAMATFLLQKLTLLLVFSEFWWPPGFWKPLCFFASSGLRVVMLLAPGIPSSDVPNPVYTFVKSFFIILSSVTPLDYTVCFLPEPWLIQEKSRLWKYMNNIFFWGGDM